MTSLLQRASRCSLGQKPRKIAQNLRFQKTCGLKAQPVDPWQDNAGASCHRWRRLQKKTCRPDELHNIAKRLKDRPIKAWSGLVPRKHTSTTMETWKWQYHFQAYQGLQNVKATPSNKKTRVRTMI